MNNEQISEDHVLELLYLRCPEFKEAIENELDAEDRKLGYTVAGSFARFLLDAHKSGRTDSLQSAAEFIEELHVRGNKNVKELGTIGYVEGIQNVWRNNEADPQVFYEYLLPESKKWWDELNRFWNGEIKYVGETFSQKN
jgi:hypothetical protein